MDNTVWPGVLLLLAAVTAFILVVAAEAGVIAGVRARALREPAESRLDALRRFSQERQLSLSCLALARNLSLIGITAIVVFLVLKETGHTWTALTVSAFATLVVLMLLQAFPRLVVSQDPERWQKVTQPVVTFLRLSLWAPAKALDMPVVGLLRWWRGRHPQEAEEAEEILRLAEIEEARGPLPEEERQMIRGIMEMEHTTVREVMVPRTDMIAIDVDEPFEKVVRLMVEKGFSRLPAYNDTIDNIMGMVYGKDALKHLARGDQVTVPDIARPAYFVPESKRVDEMLAEMKQRHLSVAIVVDEYGGTAGLITIEDLLEEIVGEIRDEFDIQEQEVQVLTSTEAVVDGRVGIDELNDMFDLRLEKDDFDSVGGFIVNELGRMPSVGDEVRVDGLSLRVLSVTGRRVKKVRVSRAGAET